MSDQRKAAKGAKPVFKETQHGFELTIPLATQQEPQQVTTKNPASCRTVKSADSRYVAGGIDGCTGTERPSEFFADLCRARAFRRAD